MPAVDVRDLGDRQMVSLHVAPYDRSAPRSAGAPPRRKDRLGPMETTYTLAKTILKPWLSTWFKWHLEGIENIPASGPALVAINHISYLDPLASAFILDKAKRIPRFLAKSELFEDKKVG